jgi:hypothetical protein
MGSRASQVLDERARSESAVEEAQDGREDRRVSGEGTDVDDALVELRLGPESIQRVSEPEGREIVAELRRCFIKGQPRVLWLGLKVAVRTIPYTEVD